MIKLFNNFNKERLVGVFLPENVKITQEINGEYSLSFTLPLSSEKRALIKHGTVAEVEGQLFKNYRSNTDMSCEYEFLHISEELRQKFIPSFGPEIGQWAQDIISKAIYDTPLAVDFSAPWVEALTDVMTQSKTTPRDIIDLVMANIGRGELYFNGRNMAVVPALGKDTGLYLDTSLNLKSLKITDDGSGIVTRLYAFGKNDLPLTNKYIDSPNITTYGIREGYRDYPDITDPLQLLYRAEREFSPSNHNRIDEPSIAYDIDYIDLDKVWGEGFKINLGDTVKLTDKIRGVDKKVRVIKIERYPFEPTRSRLTLGKPPKRLGQLIRDLSKKPQLTSGGLTRIGPITITRSDPHPTYGSFTAFTVSEFKYVYNGFVKTVPSSGKIYGSSYAYSDYGYAVYGYIDEAGNYSIKNGINYPEVTSYVWKVVMTGPNINLITSAYNIPKNIASSAIWDVLNIPL